jgi:hypothetical protein
MKYTVKSIKIVIIFLIANRVSSQNELSKLKIQLSSLDSLNKQMLQLVNELTNRESGFLNNDSIVSLNKKNIQLQITIKKLCLDTSELLKLNRKLDKKGFANAMESRVKEKTDSLVSLQIAMLKYQAELKLISERCNEEKKVQFRLGEENKLKRISDYYNLPFDTIIIGSSAARVNVDKIVIGNFNGLEKKLNDIIEYYRISDMLNVRMTQSIIETNRNRLKQIKATYSSNKAGELEEAYTHYNIYKKSLVILIRKVMAGDSIVASTPDFESLKSNGMALNAWEIFNHQYNYSNLMRYGYLRSIFFDLIDRKISNLDEPVGDLLNKLKDD